MRKTLVRSRSYTVVGQLCPSDTQARLLLSDLREADPDHAHDWGLAKILPSAGEPPYELGKLRLPPPPALLEKLESLLSNPEVRRTKAGAEALKLLRTSFKRR